MRLNINLASQPYEDARRFLLLWGTGLMLLALFTVGLTAVAIRSWRIARVSDQHIQSELRRLSELDQLQERNLAILNRPENLDVREKSRFLNTLIRRKQFSWTLVFASLERLMPTRLQVVSINPQLTEDDEILVRLRVAGDSRDKAIELVRNLEQSETFRSAQVHSENLMEARTGEAAGVIFEITAVYVSAPAQPAATASRSGD